MSPASPLASVIIPCHNYGRFLHDALDSILAQTYMNWECIIVDDGSKDDSAEVAKEYVRKEQRFTYIYQQNKGISAARNAGIERSSGEYIQFLDADDKLSSTKLELQIKQFLLHPETDIVYGDALFFDTANPEVFHKGREGSKSKTYQLKISGSGTKILKRLCVNNFIDTGAPLIRRTLIDQTGGFDTNYRNYEDWQFWFRCAIKGAHLLYLPGAGMDYFHRYGHSSMMSNKRQMIIDGIRVRKFMFPYLDLRWKVYNTYRLSKLLIKKAFDDK